MEASQAVDLRPLSIGEILDVAIKIYTRHASTLFAVVLVVVAPIQVASSLVTTSATSSDFLDTGPAGETTLDERELWIAVTGVVVVAILTGVASTLATAACFKAVADAYLGERPHWQPSLRFALRRLHSVLWVTGLAILVAFLGILLCIVPGVWLFVSFAVAVPVLLTEGVKGRRALGRSRRLVRGRWWGTFAVVLVGYVLAAIVGAVVQGLVAAATVADPGNDAVAFLSSAIGGTFSDVITTPFAAAFVTVLYFDLRVRKEGFDLELLAERVGLTPRGDRAAVVPPPLPPAPPEEPGEQPPYWPPPPGWRPSSERTDE